jgi:hypothetical protein
MTRLQDCGPYAPLIGPYTEIHIRLMKLKTMIPPVRTDPVWGRAQYGPVQPLGQTGPSPRLAVWDWTGLVWTSPRTFAISTLFLSQVPLKT